MGSVSVHISISIDYGTSIFRTVLCISDARRVTTTVLYTVTYARWLIDSLKAECNHTPLTTLTSTLFYLIALLPVTDRKGLEASGTCWHNSLRPRVLRVHIHIDSLESSWISWITQTSSTHDIDIDWHVRHSRTWLWTFVGLSFHSHFTLPPLSVRAHY